MKDEYLSLLRATGREGVEAVAAYLDKSGFFTAPASVSRHLSVDGGLLTHSMNVYHAALALRKQFIELKPETADSLKEDSVTLVSLLHDICKANVYKKIKKFRKDDNGRWEQYDGYDVDYSRFPLGHGEKSVVMLLRLGLKLTNDEILAIRWHMGAWELPFQSYETKSNISEACHTPLVTLLQTADMVAAHILETDKEK